MPNLGANHRFSPTQRVYRNFRFKKKKRMNEWKEKKEGRKEIWWLKLHFCKQINKFTQSGSKKVKWYSLNIVYAVMWTFAFKNIFILNISHYRFRASMSKNLEFWTLYSSWTSFRAYPWNFWRVGTYWLWRLVPYGTPTLQIGRL